MNEVRWLENTKTDSVNDGLKFKFQFLRHHTGYVLAIKLLQSSPGMISFMIGSVKQL